MHAATELFAERGFDRTTVRDVAARAEVNQALLFRYFGSKQELFAAVLNRSGARLLDEHPAAELPARLLEAVLAGERGADHPLVALLRSYTDERAAQVLREELGGRYSARLAELTAEPDAELRADLVLAWLFGIGMLRSVLGKEPLTSADPDSIVEHVSRSVAVLLESADGRGGS
ncbi:TetR family transcriptional regulator [Saccharopolyspora cebuensis]|uniref:TetR family transcriptional regulator n=1 Tax=Saccharopolyspora cebuensis TaxID=418759 RepID=A0ABV4CDN5_9PSEU